MTEEGKTPPETTEKGPEPDASPSKEEKTPDLEKKVESMKIEENSNSQEQKNGDGPATDDVEENAGNDEDDDSEGEPGDLDDDEIEENPAYIPKKGKYYMHDSRDEGGVDEFEAKKSRADVGSWSHDRYVERWQVPKSKKQIVAKYGFDIRYGETEEEAVEREKTTPQAEEPEVESPPALRARARGRGGVRSFRGRGAGPRGPPESQEHHEEETNENIDERAGTRRQRPVKPVTVRNVRGGRGAYPSTRGGRGGTRSFERTPRNFNDRDDGERQAPPPRRSNDGEEFMENHRRGATRGAVRGFNSQPPRQFTRTISSSTRFERGGPRPSADTKEGENGDRREPFEERRAPGGYVSNRSRGGGRGAFRGTRGQTNDFRGNSGPKRYSMQRHDGAGHGMGGMPPRQFNAQPSTDVVYFDPGAAPPPPQPSAVVYFDPSQQQHNRQLPPREKKIIEIRNPN